MGSSCISPTAETPSPRVVLVPTVARVFGAEAARPPLYSSSNSFARLINRSLVRECLVNKSAGLTSPATFLRSTLLDRTACWIQSVCVSKCLSFHSPCRLQMRMAADESVQTRSPTWMPKSRSKLW